MDKFVSTFTNKIDTKGRVSVPASFRTILAQEGFEGIYCYPLPTQPTIDAGGRRLVDQIDALLDTYPIYQERDDLASTLYGTSEILHIDQDGRTILPERLLEHAGITSHVTFVGLGKKFQIWQPERYQAHFAAIMPKAASLLGAGRRESGGPEGARE